MEDGIKRPQPDISFDELYKQAEASAPVLENTGQSILDRLKTKNPGMFEGVVFEMGPIKSRGRALDKINSDYDGDPRQIKDLVRGRFVVDTPEQIAAIKQVIIDELDIDSMKDKYAEPSSATGYRDLNTKIALENGHIAEIQIQQRDMLRVNKITHDIMEEIQAIDRQAKVENRILTAAEDIHSNTLEKQAKELHAAAAHDGKLNTLVKPELREQFAYKGELDPKGSALGKISESLGKLGKKGGLIAGTVFGSLSSAFALAAGSSKARAAEILYETAVPYGETQLDLARADMDAAARSAVIETASNIGSGGGIVAGAAAGAVIGSAVPVIGTAAGAVVGGFIGGFGGGYGAAYIMEKVYDNHAALKSGAVRLAHGAVEGLTGAAQEAKRLLASWPGDKQALDAQAAFRILPDNVAPDMPPEVAALVEVKAAPELFRKSFAEIEHHGGLPELLAYIEAHPPEAGQPAPVAENHAVHYVHLPAPGMG